MNWVIKHSKKIKYQTDLEEILKPIWDDLQNYKWLITDVDFITDSQIPLNFEKDYFFLDRDEFAQLMNSDTQIIWGVISAVSNNYKIDEKKNLTLSSESEQVWKENVFQISESILEIIAFDSGYTILKFKNNKLSEKFKNYFESEAIELCKLK
ncbi:hypothetical protein [Epilithonimonas hominis]|uniref:Uncharacterized protein n=1 Tax=Epilithonimonas hominis TaxID=420404 RepID=A0A1H6K352_9FLAO|nr:hypothetical protein [Epilithonimonas hominis]SEH66181.1 hypothetical protein SAMN05421793_11836 [Epilithonimonas hominis]